MRKQLLALALLALPFTAAQARVDCDIDDDWNNSSFEKSYDFDFEYGDLVAEEGSREIMRITPDGDFYVRGNHVDVSDHQRELLVTYYQQVEEIKDDAIDIGFEAARFGIRTAVSAVFMALSGDKDDAEEFERTVEAEAEQFEKFARGMCTRVDALVKIEKILADEIPEFVPMVKRGSDLTI